MSELPTPNDLSPLPVTVLEAANPMPAGAPADSLAVELPRAGACYRIEGEIGRGGMGVVLRVRDGHLGRDLAAKVLLPEQLNSESSVRRFLEEARVTGQLQHPGVPPVHDLGRLADGRPYFTMKLVKGDTLAALLRQRPNPAAELPRFLKVFEQVCQTVAYAHSKGVIHRDLKPANVMVGRFGEVQVMDWGLAKVLARRGDESAEDVDPSPDGPSVIHTLRGEAAETLTQSGSIIGTFAYMPPEQARGETERLDERCDVFGLGAVLCQILTGLPPYSDRDREVVRAKARQGELSEAFARFDRCGSDHELIALAKHCLAVEMGDRPRAAGEVAQAVTAYLTALDERARQAEVERAAAQARAEEARAKAAAERRARRLTLALAAAVVAVLAVGGTGAWVVQQQQQAQEAEAARRQAETDRTVRASLDKAQLFFDEVKNAPPGDPGRLLKAQAAAQKAADLALVTEAAQELGRQAAALLAEVDAEAAAQQQDRRLLVRLLEVRGPREGPRFRKDGKGFLAVLAEPSADEQFAQAFRGWGLDIDATPTAMAVARLRTRPAMLTEVVAALDEWASERRRQRRPKAEWQRLVDLAAAADDGPGAPRRRELRAMLMRGRLPLERALGLLSMVLRPGSWPLLLDSGLGADRQRLRQLAQRTDAATEPVLGLVTLVRALRVAGDEAAAERLLQAAVQARPQEVVLRSALGELLEGQRPPRWQDAVACYEAARALRPELGVSLAQALVQSGRLDQGLKLFQRLTEEKRDNPWLHFQHGLALHDVGRPREAEAALRLAIRLKSDDQAAHANLAVALRDQARYQEAEAVCREAIRLNRDLPEPHNTLGVVLLALGRYKEAEAAFRKASRLSPEYPLPHYNLGNALNHQGRCKEAEVAGREAIRLKPDFPEAHLVLGNALHDQDRLDEAEATYREAIRLRPHDSLAHANLGNTLKRQGRHQEAEAACREAIRLKPDFPAAHVGLGGALSEQGRHKEAEAACREAIRLKQDFPKAHIGLAVVLNAQGRHEEAEGACRQAIQFEPMDAMGHYILMIALNGQRRYKEAEAACRAAIRLQYDFPKRHAALGAALGLQGRHKEAEEACREAIRLKDAEPSAHANLGNSLVNQGRHKEAEAACREAIRLDPNHPTAHYNLGITLHGQRRYKEAEAAYRETIRLQPELARAHFNLGLALYHQGRHKEAEAPYREAIRLQPDDSEAHFSLAIALFRQGRAREAELSYREAIRLKPAYPQAHSNLGIALVSQGRRQEAEACYREAIRLKPDMADAHCNLGHVLRDQGRFADALISLRRGHALGSKAAGWPYPSAEWVRQCERLLVLERELPDFLQGDKQPANAVEHLQIAMFCQLYQRRHAAAARFFAEAFAVEPKLAADLRQQLRYRAASSAALAASGNAVDAKALAVEEWDWLQAHAHDWLRGDLATYTRLVEKGDPAAREAIQKRLADWQTDPDLLAVRDRDWLAAMPAADRARWQQLWAEVAALLRKASKEM